MTSLDITSAQKIPLCDRRSCLILDFTKKLIQIVCADIESFVKNCERAVDVFLPKTPRSSGRGSAVGRGCGNV